MGQSMQYIISFADIIKRGQISRQNRHHKKRSFGEIGDHKKRVFGPIGHRKKRANRIKFYKKKTEENGKK